MIGEPNPDNRAAIEHYGSVRCARGDAAFRSADAGVLAKLGRDAPGGLSHRMSLADRDRAVLWHPYTQMLTAPAPLPIVRAEGVWLYTEDGRRILDGISSWWVNIHGHSHPKLNAALAAQARELEHVVFAGCTHRPAVELAERLLEILPKGLARVFYSDNGSTAVEVALKLAVQYWQNRGAAERRTFITLHNAYHGDTVGAMSASEDSIFTRAFSTHAVSGRARRAAWKRWNDACATRPNPSPRSSSSRCCKARAA